MIKKTTTSVLGKLTAVVFVCFNMFFVFKLPIQSFDFLTLPSDCNSCSKCSSHYGCHKRDQCNYCTCIKCHISIPPFIRSFHCFFQEVFSQSLLFFQKGQPPTVLGSTLPLVEAISDYQIYDYVARADYLR